MEPIQKAIHMLGSNDQGLQTLGVASFIYKIDAWAEYLSFMKDPVYKTIDMATRLAIRKGLIKKLGKRDDGGKLIKKYKL